MTDLKKTKKIMKERPEQRAARWIHYDRRIQELVDDYQNYANKMNFLKAIGHITARVTIKARVWVKLRVSLAGRVKINVRFTLRLLRQI